MRRPAAPMPSSTAAMADVFADTVIGAYQLAGRAAVPLMPIALSWRARRGKEDGARLGERFGRASRQRPEGQLVWIHAASVGETNATMPLVEEIVHGGAAVLFTSVTVTSAGIAALSSTKSSGIVSVVISSPEGTATISLCTGS